MTGFGHDPHDAEWENPNTGRTVYRPGTDDDYCESCDGTIVSLADGTQRCRCDATTETSGIALRGSRMFVVRTTVETDDRSEIVVVPGDNEWQARTNARVVSTLALHGETIDYEVVEVPA